MVIEKQFNNAIELASKKALNNQQSAVGIEMHNLRLFQSLLFQRFRINCEMEKHNIVVRSKGESLPRLLFRVTSLIHKNQRKALDMNLHLVSLMNGLLLSERLEISFMCLPIQEVEILHCNYNFLHTRLRTQHDKFYCCLDYKRERNKIMNTFSAASTSKEIEIKA